MNKKKPKNNARTHTLTTEWQSMNSKICVSEWMVQDFDWRENKYRTRTLTQKSITERQQNVIMYKVFFLRGMILCGWKIVERC